MNLISETTNATSVSNCCLKCGTKISPEKLYCKKCRRKGIADCVLFYLADLLVPIFIYSFITFVFPLGNLLETILSIAVLVFSFAFAHIKNWHKFKIHYENKALPKIETNDSKFVVGTDFPQGKYKFKSTKQIPGSITIQFPNGKEKNIYIDGNKIVNLKHGTIIELNNCDFID